MIDAGILPGDILIVDRSITPKNRDIVIASLDGEFTVKYLIHRGRERYLYPANKNFSKIRVDNREDFLIWGVVTYGIHSFNRL